MIQIFLDQYPGMQPRRRQATVDQRRRNGSCGDRFTGAACILRPNVAMNEETCRFDIQLLADILTNLDQAGTALPTGAGCGFMTVLDARQFWRNRLTPGRLRTRLLDGALKLCEFGRNGGLIFVAGLKKQILLRNRQGFTLGAKLDSSCSTPVPASVSESSDRAA